MEIALFELYVPILFVLALAMCICMLLLLNFYNRFSMLGQMSCLVFVYELVSAVIVVKSNYKNTQFLLVLHVLVRPSQKHPSADISETKSGIIDPLVSKRPEKI